MRRNDNCDVDVRRLFHQAKLSWGQQRWFRSQDPHGDAMTRSPRYLNLALTLFIVALTLTFWGVILIDNVLQSL